MIASRKPPQPAAPVVYIIDDDASMQESLVDLFRSMSIEAVALATRRPSSRPPGRDPDVFCWMYDCPI